MSLLGPGPPLGPEMRQELLWDLRSGGLVDRPWGGDADLVKGLGLTCCSLVSCSVSSLVFGWRTGVASASGGEQPKQAHFAPTGHMMKWECLTWPHFLQKALAQT